MNPTTPNPQTPEPVQDDMDFELPQACPLRNNGDDICESCQ